MKNFLLTIAFLFVLFFGVRTFCSQGLTPYVCIPYHAQDVPEINKYAAEITLIRSRLESELARFKGQSIDAEFCLNHILQLLDLELEIADCLIDKKTGLPVNQLIDRRNKLISQTVPSVVRVYDLLMNYATADASLLCKLRNVIDQQQRLWTVLFYDEREHFLCHMTDIFETYYKALKNIPC